MTRLRTCAGILAAVGPGLVAMPPAMAQEVAAGRLTMEVEAEPLADVLARIGAAAGFEVETQGEVGDVEPQSFDGVPLDVAIRRLVGSHSLIMVHEPGAPGGLAEVKVYAALGDPAERRAESAQQARRSAVRQKRTDEQRSLKSDRSQRVQEVRELARSGDPGAVRALGEIALQDQDPAVRRLAVGSLASIGDQSAATVLASALDDQDRAVRVQALRALNGMLGDQVAPHLARVVAQDTEPSMRLMAVEMAANLPGGAAMEVLERALDDGDRDVRDAAEEALAR
jgi:HEAT repeats